jgi:hypothetical protein
MYRWRLREASRYLLGTYSAAAAPVIKRLRSRARSLDITPHIKHSVWADGSRNLKHYLNSVGTVYSGAFADPHLMPVVSHVFSSAADGGITVTRDDSFPFHSFSPP